MNSLGPQKLKDTYPLLLQVAEATTSLAEVANGAGTTLSLELATDKARFLGPLQIPAQISFENNVSSPDSPASGSAILYTENDTLKIKFASGSTINVAQDGFASQINFISYTGTPFNGIKTITAGSGISILSGGPSGTISLDVEGTALGKSILQSANTTNLFSLIQQSGPILLYSTTGVLRGMVGIPSWGNSYVSLQNRTLPDSAINSAINQNSSGTTKVNSASGQSLQLAVANITAYTINSDRSSTFQTNATFIPLNNTGVPVKIQGVASQSANLTEWTNSSGTILTRISSDGALFLQTTRVDGIGGFRVAAGTGLFDINEQSKVTIKSGDVSHAILDLKGLSSHNANYLQLFGVSSTSTERIQAFITPGWTNSTDASRLGNITIGVYGIVSGVETKQIGLTINAEGTGNPNIKFGLGNIHFNNGTPIARPNIVASGATVTDILNALENLGLITTS